MRAVRTITTILFTSLLLCAGARGADTVTTIAFDHLPVGDIVTEQYSAQGVIFWGRPNSVRIVDADPPGTISGTQALEVVTTGDLPEHAGPMKFRFRSYQHRVKVYVGRILTVGDTTVQAVLRVYDGSGSLIGSQYTVIGGAAREVRTPLEVDVGTNRIVRAEVQYIHHYMLDGTEWDEDTFGIEIIDNLTFEGEPPPPPPEDDPPSVHITRPTNGQVFYGTDDMIRLEGTVAEDNGLSSLTIGVVFLDHDPDFPAADLEWAGSAPEFTFPESPSFRLQVHRGRNRITVTARDSRSQVDSETVEVIFANAPVIAFTSPADGHETSNLEVVVTGTVTKPFGALHRSDVTYATPPTAARTTVDTLTGSAATGYAFSARVALEGVGSRDLNTIRVEALDEGGLRGRADLDVYVVRPNRVLVSSLEATQSTSSEYNIAGKSTVVRITPRTSGAGAVMHGVEAVLHGFRDGVELPGSPLSPLWDDDLDLDPSEDAQARRADVSKTWNFELPWSWTSEGTIRLRAAIDPENELVECESCLEDNILEEDVEFRRGEHLTIQPISVSCLWNGVRTEPTAADVLQSLEAIERVYPYSGITIFAATTHTSNVDLGLGAKAGRHAMLREINDDFSCWDSYYSWGVIEDWFEDCSWSTYNLALMPLSPAGGCPGGVAYLHSPGAIAQAIPWTAAHELGHAVGLEHAGNSHGEDGGGGYDPYFPYEHGRFGWSNAVGFDIEAWVAIPVEEPYPPGSPDLGGPCGNCDPATADCHTHDFMSYGDNPTWISEYMWSHIFLNGFGGGVRGGGGVLRQPLDGPGGGGSFTQVIHVTGSVEPDGEVEFRAFYTLPAPPGLSFSLERGEFEARVLDGLKNVLAARRFDAVQPQDADGAWISRLLPLMDGAASIEILRDGAVIETRKISASPPKVTVLEPNGGETYAGDDAMLVRWKASDPDGQKLSYGVQYTPDDGVSWHNLAFLIGETQMEVRLADLPGGSAARIQVMATDGVLSGRDASDAVFKVGGKPPYPLILRPRDGATVRATDLTVFEGTASDREDGAISPIDLTWHSSLNGLLGRGNRIDAGRLNPGTHRIRLTAEDSSGASAAVEIDLEVVIAMSRFVRGDADGSKEIDITDPIYLLGFLFVGSAIPPCQDAADANDDGSLDISDAIYTLSFLFGGGDAPRAPYPLAGYDRTIDALSCARPPI